MSVQPLTSILTSTKKRATPDLASASEATKVVYAWDYPTFLGSSSQRGRDLVEMQAA
jgi:hypothetical protein